MKPHANPGRIWPYKQLSPIARRDCDAMAEERLALQDALTASRADYARSAREAANLQATATDWETKREAREHWPESAKGLVADLEDQMGVLRGKVDGLEAIQRDVAQEKRRTSRRHRQLQASSSESKLARKKDAEERGHA